MKVLQREHPAGALAKLGEAGEGPGGGEPHRWRHHGVGDDGQTAPGKTRRSWLTARPGLACCAYNRGTPVESVIS